MVGHVVKDRVEKGEGIGEEGCEWVMWVQRRRECRAASRALTGVRIVITSIGHVGGCWNIVHFWNWPDAMCIVFLLKGLDMRRLG